MSSGEADAIPGPRFGMSLDRWRRCASAGCEWRAYGALLCSDHGGKAPYDEYRVDAFGLAEWRHGFTGKVVTPTRTA